MVADPVPALDPAAVAPVDVIDDLGVVGVTPTGEDEDDLATEGDGDVLLVVEQILPVLLAEVRRHLLGTLDHGGTDHRPLALPQEAENVVGTVTDGQLRGEDGGLDEDVAELLDLPGVTRVDQGREALGTELLLEVSQFTEVIHGNISCPFLQRAHSSPTTGKEEDGCLFPAFSFFP